jgi:hypothetical protein
VQIAPWVSLSFNPRSLDWRQEPSKERTAVFRRGCSPAARSKGRRGLRGLRGFERTTCRGSWRSEKGISTRARGGGEEVTVDGSAPVVNVNREPAHELQ